jgi:hypothetical protein
MEGFLSIFLHNLEGVVFCIFGRINLHQWPAGCGTLSWRRDSSIADLHP